MFNNFAMLLLINFYIHQSHRKHLKPGGMTLQGPLFSKYKGAFPENKGFSLFIAKSWVHVPQVLLVSTAMTFMFIIFRSLVSERSKR